ncbi:uncharacterized protein TNIN_107661 [Trichonephila inaurata madagascariensis]|uniref:Uncharacterized protein n=1 Tax=Trichonephila inaurata madagascariensis TaxID=2747483 RepID=A0A8X6Y883_9ARAC|nr:uncharacterized protein TNIN_107661 [Trichonephila inaurata madagascariensis]
MIQNPKFNIVECIEGVDNLKQYLVSQRSVDNFKISVDSVTTLARDSGIDPKFPISKLRKKVYLFVYEGVMREQASNSFLHFAISSANGRFTLLSECYSIFSFCMFHNISADDVMKV